MNVRTMEITRELGLLFLFNRVTVAFLSRYANASLSNKMGIFQGCVKIQWLPFENRQSPFYVVNEVNLTGQKPSLKFC